MLRSRNVADPTSWRGWSGTGFTVTFPSPYTNTLDPSQHVCQPVNIGTLSESLGWSTYFKKWVLVGSSDNADGVNGPGFYFFTSDDLINWSPAKLLMKAELPWTYQCNDPPFVRDPSLLDPAEQDPQLRHDRTAPVPVLHALQRLLVLVWARPRPDPDPDRVLQPGAGRAGRGAGGLDRAPRTGEPVTFDASGSRDEDGSITKFEWDLDGDGSTSATPGREPVAEKTYSVPDSVTVTVRVSDDDGKATDETMVVRIGGPGEAPRNAAGGPAPAAVGAVGRTSAPHWAPGARALTRSQGRSRWSGCGFPRRGCCGCERPAEPQPIRATRVNAGRAGVVRVAVRASLAGRADLAKRGSMRIRAAFTFTPVGGATQRAVHTLSLQL